MSGGGAGGGLGATLGTIAAAALAPETGGASLLFDAGIDAGLAGAITGAGLGSIGGAAGGALGAAISGGDPGKAAESGGIGGFLGGGVSGLLGGGGDAIAGTTADSLKAAPEAGVSTPSGVDAATTDTAAGVTAPSGVSDATGSSVSPGSLVNPGNSTNFIPQTSGDLSYSAGSGVGSGSSSIPSSVPLGGTTGATGAGSGTTSPDWWSRNAPSWLGGNSSPSPSPVSGSAANNISGNAAIASGAAKDSGSLSQYLMPAGLLLGGVSSLFPSGGNPVNTSNAAAAQNKFSAALPNYNYNKALTPYSGNWYTYGQRPTTTPMQINTLTPAKKGGLIGHYAIGGLARPVQIPLSKMPVRHFDAGGMVPAPGPVPVAMNRGSMPPSMPQGVPPAQGMLPRPAGMPPASPGAMEAPAQAPNPLLQLLQPGATPKQNAARYEIGRRVGSVVRQKLLGMTPDGMVNGPGGGQDDVVPAKLSQNEYVIPADVVSQLGDGSSNAGGKKLDQMVHSVRAHKTAHGAKFPPKAHDISSYLRGK